LNYIKNLQCKLMASFSEADIIGIVATPTTVMTTTATMKMLIIRILLIIMMMLIMTIIRIFLMIRSRRITMIIICMFLTILPAINLQCNQICLPCAVFTIENPSVQSHFFSVKKSRTEGKHDCTEGFQCYQKKHRRQI